MEKDVASRKKRPRGQVAASDEESPEPRKRAAKAAADKAKGASKSAKDESEQKKRSSDQLNFPEKLMQLINEDMAPDHVAWIENEEAISFKTDGFQEHVLDKFFQGLKYDSFVRKLNRWGFRRVTSEGIAAGTVAYYHNSFRKDEQELLKTMGIGKKNDPEVRDLQAFGGEHSMIGSTSAAISRESLTRSDASFAVASAPIAHGRLDRHFLDTAMGRQQSLGNDLGGLVTAVRSGLTSPASRQESKTDAVSNVIAQTEVRAGMDSQQLLLEAMLARQRQADVAALQEREAAVLAERAMLERSQQRRSSSAAITSALARDDEWTRQLAALRANPSVVGRPMAGAHNPFATPQQPLLPDLASRLNPDPALTLLLQQRLQASSTGTNLGLGAGASLPPSFNPLANVGANVNINQGGNLNLNIQGNLNPFANAVANAGNRDLESLWRLILQNRQRDAQGRGQGDQGTGRPPGGPGQGPPHL